MLTKKPACFLRANCFPAPQRFGSIPSAFFLDCVSFVFKTNPCDDAANPRSRVWRKKNERLQFCAKGSSTGTGGRLLHLCVAISYGRGVVFVEAYDRLTSATFSAIVKKHFKKCAFASPRLFLMDNDPVQNSSPCKKIISSLGFSLLKIPARSPDLNPIENLFGAVKKTLRAQAVERGLGRESFQEFKTRVVSTLMTVGASLTDRLIASMAQRVRLLVAKKGERLRF